MRTGLTAATAGQVPLSALWTALLLGAGSAALLLRHGRGDSPPWLTAAAALGVLVPCAGVMWRGRRHLGTQGAAVFLAALLSYWPLELSGRLANGGDSLWYVPSAISLLGEGNLELSEYREDLGRLPPWIVWVNDMENDPRILHTPGGYHQGFPLGNALACVPAAFLGNVIYGAIPSPMDRSLKITYLAARTFAALGVALLYVLLRLLGAGAGVALAVTLLFAWASPQASLHGAALWSHNILIPFLLLGLILVTLDGGRLAWLSALPFSVMFHLRPESAVLIAAATGYMLLRHRSQLPAFCLLGAASFLFYLSYSRAVFGDSLGGYYSVKRAVAHGNFLEALAGHFVSPNRGMLVFTPLFGFSLAGMAVWWRRRSSFSPVYLLAAFMIVVYLGLVSWYPSWTAGACYGPRRPAAVFPLLALFLVPAWEWARGLRPTARAVTAAVAAAAVAWSVFVQVRGVTDWDVHHWNSVPDPYPRRRAWDWGNLQILYGLGEDIASKPAWPEWIEHP